MEGRQIKSVGDSVSRFCVTGAARIPLRGADGKSAYEIACEHGFEGSEAEWVESISNIPADGSITPEKLSESLQAELKDVVDKSHTHINATLLDAITTDDVAAWNNAAENSSYSGTTTMTVGGVAKGTVFSGSSVTDVLDALLCPYVKPSVTLTASGSLVYESGVSAEALLTVNVTEGSKSVTSVTIVGGGKSYTLKAAAGAQTQAVDVTDEKCVYTANVSDGKSRASADIAFTRVNPFYYSTVSSAPSDSNGVKALTKLVEAKGTKMLPFTTADDAPYYCLCYPASYGALESAKDANGFENLDTFTRTTVSVTNAAETSVDYYVYTYNNAVSAGTMKFTFTF